MVVRSNLKDRRDGGFLNLNGVGPFPSKMPKTFVSLRFNGACSPRLTAAFKYSQNEVDAYLTHLEVIDLT